MRILPLLVVAGLGACKPSLTVPTPSLEGVTPEIVCGEQLVTVMTVSGAGLTPLPVDTVQDVAQLILPVLSLNSTADLFGGPSDAGPYALTDVTTWLDENTMTVDVSENLSLVPAVYSLSVENPDGTLANAPGVLAVVSAPAVTAVSPQIRCVGEQPQPITLTGTAFLAIGDTLPTVEISGVPLVPDALEDCLDLVGPVVGRVCTTIQVTLPVDVVAPGVHEILVVNPETAACTTPEPVLIEIVPEPRLDDIAPQPECIDQSDQELVATGGDFLVLEDGTLPSLAIGSHTTLATGARNCVDLQGPAGGQLCETLDLTLAVNAEVPGVFDVVVTNPEPAACSTDAVPFEIVSEPTVQQVAPEQICLDQRSETLVLTGGDFVMLADGSLPTVRVGSFETVATSLTECVDLLGPQGGQSCTVLEAVVAAEALTVGVYSVEVDNPDPAECLSPVLVFLEVIPPPVVDEVVPLTTCLDQGTREVLLTGSSFLALADGTLPTVSVGDVTLLADSVDNCVDLTGPAGGRLCTGVVATLPEDAVTAGVHSLFVTNPGTADCVSVEERAVEVVPAPTVTAVVESLTCGAQADTFTLAGTGFIDVNGQLPTVGVGGTSLLAAAVDGCVDLTGPGGGRTCTSLTFAAGEGMLDLGVLDVTVTNPQDTDCTTEAPVTLQVIAAPQVLALDPGDVCSEAGDVTVIIDGAGFAFVDGIAPTVRVGDRSYTPELLDCVPLGDASRGEVCATAIIDVPAGAHTDIGLEAVFVDNPAPAACSSVDDVSWVVGPPPVLDQVTPTLTCSGEDLTLIGSGFVAASSVQVGGLDASSSLVDGGTLTAEIPGGLDSGTYDVSVSNPGMCADEAIAAVTLVDPPEILSVSQDLTCADNVMSFTVSGSNFIQAGDGTTPTVTVGGVSAFVDNLTGCVPGSGGSSICDSASVTVSAGLLQAGVAGVVLTNPAPADCSSAAFDIDVVGPPTVAAVQPVEQCWEFGAFSVEVSGAGFLRLDDGTLPRVRFEAGTQSVAFAVQSAADCVALDGPSGAETCGILTVAVPEATWSDDLVTTIIVENPAPAACESDDDVTFTLYDPPTVTEVDPFEVCYGGLEVAVRGEGFREGPTGESPTVFFDGVTAQSVTFVSSIELTVILPEAMVPGDYDVLVINPDTCEDTLSDGLTVVEPPIVFFVDPPVTYTGISVQATVYAAGINHDVDAMWLQATDGTERVPVTGSLDFTYDPTDPIRVSTNIPDGLTPGDYDMVLLDQVGCEVSLPTALFAESELTVAIDDVDPPFGWTDSFTPVTISGLPFGDLPRVYLSLGDGTAATELASLTWVSETQLDAVVPEGLPVGSYDIIAVNPNNTIGLLLSGFEVTTDPPPLVDAVAPGSVPSGGDEPLAIEGENFREAEVHYACIDPVDGDVHEADPAPGTTVTVSDTLITTTIPANTLSGRVCEVQITNSDGTTARYASVSVTNSSQNLYPWNEGPSLQLGRRAPVGATGRATRRARYIYAIGGDGGDTSDVYDSIELARVGVYGDLGEWDTLTNGLPAPRTLSASARLGRFVYVVGGNDGSGGIINPDGGAVNTVWRAQVLDPLVAPRIVDLGIDLGDGNQVGPGTWTYRVSATYPASFDPNPAGEGLASDPFVVRVPDVPETFLIALTWSEVPSASGYRVYRSPVADSGSGSEVLVAEVAGGSGTSWIDDGAPLTGTPVRPLQNGSIGRWQSLAPLPEALQAPCVAIAADPSGGDAHVLVAAGGRTGDGLVRDSVWTLPLSVVSEHDQDWGVWGLAGTLTEARWQCGAASVDSSAHSAIPDGDTWVYIGGGATSGSFTGTTDAFLVGTAGALDDQWEVDSMATRGGYGFAHASNFLYALGGRNGDVETSGQSARICEPGMSACGGAIPDPPDLRNWNSLGGGSLAIPVYLPGSAQESSVIFLFGGESSTGAGSTRVQLTNY